MATVIQKTQEFVTTIITQPPERKRPKPVDAVLTAIAYSTAKPADKNMKVEMAEGERVPQVVRDTMSMAINILKNEHLKPPQKIAALTKLSDKLRTGWPFKNTARFNKFSTGLSEKTLAMANCILAIEKVKSGKKDTGVIES